MSEKNACLREGEIGSYSIMGKYVLCFRAPLNVNKNSSGPLTPWERMWPECNSHNKHIISSS